MERDRFLDEGDRTLGRSNEPFVVGKAVTEARLDKGADRQQARKVKPKTQKTAA